MINIFKEGTKRRPRHSKRKKNVSKKELEEKGRAALDKLNPMVIPLLAINLKSTDQSTVTSPTFIQASIDVINNRPHALSEKWISSLNNWVDGIVSATMLDEPDIALGERINLGPIGVMKIVPPKVEAQYPMPALILVDERGWKWYTKTSKAYMFQSGDQITLSAKASSHGEGITFLSRPTKIKKVIKIGGKND